MAGYSYYDDGSQHSIHWSGGASSEAIFREGHDRIAGKVFSPFESPFVVEKRQF